jgi:hypothetical protein
MGLFTCLGLSSELAIDWQMNPEYSFGTFESWGGRERVRSETERVYYFFIDAWGDESRLCLMERGVKHARVVAEITAPPEMLNRCVTEQGKVALFERTFAINEEVKRWLEENVVEDESSSLVTPLTEKLVEASGDATTLPPAGEPVPKLSTFRLPSRSGEMSEEDVVALVKKYDFVDHERNPQGSFSNYLVDNDDGLTVTDKITGIMWQRGGVDIMSYRSMQNKVKILNQDGVAGYSDWRIPSMAEALSLMEQSSTNDQFLHPCFSAQQPFIFVDGIRKPGGYWFVDFKHGRAFWASGTIPGGFGRFCRSE